MTWHLTAPSGEDSAGEPLATILTLHPTKFNQCFDAVVQIILSLWGSGCWQCRPPIIDRPGAWFLPLTSNQRVRPPRPRPSRHFGTICPREASPRAPVDEDAGCTQHGVLPRRRTGVSSFNFPPRCLLLHDVASRLPPRPHLDAISNTIERRNRAQRRTRELGGEHPAVGAAGGGRCPTLASPAKTRRASYAGTWTLPPTPCSPGLRGARKGWRPWILLRR